MSRESLQARAIAARAQREAAHRRRHARTVARREGVRCSVDGREVVNFCSNDYLGLSQHPQVIAALRDAAGEGAGATASHLVCGHGEQHAALERELADWLQAPRALLFGSGYMANLAVLQALLGDGDLCVQDKLNHASLIDAARLGGCVFKRYPHADAEGAARQLATQAGGAALLSSDGVFSMDGDVAPLGELARVARAQQAALYIDDAHGVGVLGEAGRGSVDHAGLASDAVPLRLVTFGKALGGAGAAVIGDADLIGHLAETARPYIYTTALPPAQVAATREAVRIARTGDGLRERLNANIERLKAGAQARGLALMPSDTPIQPLLVGSDAQALAMAAALEDQGCWVAPIRPPTVPEGSARLRITLSAAHETAQVEGLLDALARARDRVMA
ncbi:8-amino-7-oxononanoate synthase [Thermomonas aquatica]|uniref:8-amino-7-oxononanoate synthase n=1 Tax=Thermomonas aquatica TaxID=2202149 RepID=A0A5B7ZQE7_9GAMM|nr:8-amino-7-oxononanoate synthase [Thermomonas aquatica]QDA57401.1 8-amino-7-oxononanoate synthase [Thermomonas aquatica]